METSQNDVNLRDLFQGLQAQLRSTLDTVRNNVSHPGTKGDATELGWIKMLRNYIPKRYKVDKAFVIDSNGKISEQIDIVIYDQHYSPFFFNQDDTLYIPAESVYAVIEVKQNLNKEHIQYAGTKARSVRSLHRTSAPIVDKGGVRKGRKLFNILAGIVTFSNSWIPPFEDSFKQTIDNLEDGERIDFGCALDSGSFKISYDGGTSVESSNADDALIFFFLTLLSKLQEVGTVPAMDISKYERVLKS